MGMGLWLQIFVLDPHDEKIMYLPAQRELWRNSDLNQIPYVFPAVPTDMNWTRITNLIDHVIIAMGMSKAEPRKLYYMISSVFLPQTMAGKPGLMSAVILKRIRMVSEMDLRCVGFRFCMLMISQSILREQVPDYFPR